MGNSPGTQFSGTLADYIKPALDQEQASDIQTVIYRNPAALNNFKSTPDPNFHSLRDMLEESVRLYGNKPFLGTRYYRREYYWKTYQECYSLAQKLAHGIIYYNLGVSRKETYQMVGIYSNNREEWVIVDMACMMLGVVTIPVYETLGQANINYIIRQTGITTMFCSREGLSMLVASNNFNLLKSLVCFDNPDLQDLDAIKNYNVEMISLGKVLRKGEERLEILENASLNNASAPPNEESSGFKTSSESPLDSKKNIDRMSLNQGNRGSSRNRPVEIKNTIFPPLNEQSIFTICFTSGTVSEPKGVVLTHGNFLSSLEVVESSNTVCNTEDRHLSYLPLAHIFERVFMLFVMFKGASAAFYQGEVLKLKEDLEIVKPTIFVSLPRLLEKLEEGFRATIEALSPFRRSFIKKGLETKLREFQKNGSLKHSFYDLMAFSRFREALGGRIKYIFTGSAPLPKKTEEFLQIVLSCPIILGYGLTESTGPIFFKRFTDKQINHIGGPARNIEFKLVDVPDWGFKTRESDLTKPIRGEIYIRGPAVFQGYFKMDKLKKDEWFPTGDVGELLENGRIKIVGRVINILKLSNGEKVSLERLEHVYSFPKMIEDILICPKHDRSGLVAIVVPDKFEVLKYSRYLGIPGDFENFIQTEKFKNCLTQEFMRIARAENLFDWEKIQCIHCEPQSFKQLGLLSESLKKKRGEAQAYYRSILESL